MLNYYLQDGLFSYSDIDSAPQGVGRIKVMTFSEYSHQYHNTEHYSQLHRGFNPIHCCKADIMRDFITGTFLVPEKSIEKGTASIFGFYISDSQLFFIDDGDFVATMLHELKSTPIGKTSSLPHFLFNFMEYLIKDDVFFLQNYEEYLTQLEEQLADNNRNQFNQKMLEIRKQLSALNMYYEQLEDMAEDLQESPLVLKEENDRWLFSMFANRCGRLFSDVQILKEYSMQLREMHQAQIDIRQNQIMQFLTVVTTIFMPLTLITGWYGMNFTFMPELASRYGYIVICVISLIIVLVECWLFYIKKWFD